MLTDSIDLDFIRKTIPNILFEVDGESPISEKLAPFIADASERLLADYLASDDFLNQADRTIAQKYVVYTAFADAVPSLDIVATPTGFGVVSTETVAPASKDRVERLIDSLRKRAESILEILIERLRTYPQWRSSERGAYFCSTFLSNPRDVVATGADSYENMRSEALQAESFIARHFIGANLMKMLRNEYNARDSFMLLELHEAVRSAVLESVRLTFKNCIPNPNAIWRLIQPALHLLRNDAKYCRLWQEEMGNLYDNLQFKNDVKGSFYF